MNQKMELSKEAREAREARNRYAREWKRKNPDKVKAAMIRHWEKKAAFEGQSLFTHIIKLNEQGLTVQEIAFRLGKGEQEINSVIEKYNQT